MKSLKIMLLASFLFLTSAAYAQTYRATVFVENSGEVIGSWTGTATPQAVSRNKPAQVVSLVNAKSVSTGVYNYNLGFDIKMSVVKVSGGSQLMLASSFSSLSDISAYTKQVENDESTVTLGKVFKTQYNTNPNQAPIVLNTILFTNAFDITNPRGVIVPIGRFIAEANTPKASLVNLKLKVERY